MNAKLIVEGKEFDIEILDPKLQELLVPKAKKTGYEKARDYDEYYWVDKIGNVCVSIEDRYPQLYENANYYSDKTIAENNARADKLMRQLRRFAVEHRDNNLDWSNSSALKYTIRYGYSTGFMVGRECFGRDFGAIFFNSEETAQLAINTFRDELIWYFTEYKDSL